MSDRAATARAGVTGVLLTLNRPAAKGLKATPTTKVSVDLNYAAFADAFGGDWGSRLRLVQRPACALTTPELAACQAARPVAFRNDSTAQTQSAEVSVSEGVTALGRGRRGGRQWRPQGDRPEPDRDVAGVATDG